MTTHPILASSTNNRPSSLSPSLISLVHHPSTSAITEPFLMLKTGHLSASLHAPGHGLFGQTYPMVLRSSIVMKGGNTWPKYHKTLTTTTSSTTSRGHHQITPCGPLTLQRTKVALCADGPIYGLSHSPQPTTHLQPPKLTYSLPSLLLLTASRYPKNGMLPSTMTHQELPGDRRMMRYRAYSRTPLLA